MSRRLTGLCARPVLFRKGPEIGEDDDDDWSESANQIKKMPTVVRISATPQLPLFQIMNQFVKNMIFQHKYLLISDF